jgi:hypothetical protein
MLPYRHHRREQMADEQKRNTATGSKAGSSPGGKQRDNASSDAQGDQHGDTEDPVSRRKGTGRHGEWIRRGTTDSPGAVDPQDETDPEK